MHEAATSTLGRRFAIWLKIWTGEANLRCGRDNCGGRRRFRSATNLGMSPGETKEVDLLRCMAAAAALAASGSAWAQDLDTGWRTYVNARFGVAVEYPDVFSLRDPEPANGDGQVFRTPDGEAKLTVYGSYNVNRKSPGELLEAYKTAGVDYSYATASRNWFVLSGVKAGTIGYMRCNLAPPDVVGCFDIEYPASQARRWAPVVERLGRSLRLSPVRP